MAVMTLGWLRSLAFDVGEIAWGNRYWMVWNTLLAVLPAAIAVVLFRHDGRRGATWWALLVGFVLLLPNAPYVITDLVHLRSDVLLTETDGAVYGGVVPLYALFIGIGLLSYAACIHEVGRFLRRTGRAALVGRVEIALHALCAIGVLLGRVARLNSWDTITDPSSTVERALATLSWGGSPTVIGVLFVVIWLGHATTRSLLLTLWEWLGRHVPAPT